MRQTRITIRMKVRGAMFTATVWTFTPHNARQAARLLLADAVRSLQASGQIPMNNPA